jgi:primase-polymerase (primpol)-like protein
MSSHETHQTAYARQFAIEMDIPAELKELDQWVTWNADKVPLRPATGRPAKVNDPSTWGSFEAASATGRVGFVFSHTDPFVGIDLDKCRDPVTGQIEDWALEKIDSLDSYSEVSPSGRGIHIFCRGKLPFSKGRKRGQCEIYEHSRYFTVTGNRLECSPKEIHDRQNEIEGFCDSCFSEEQEGNANGSQLPPVVERRVTEPRKWRFEWHFEEILIKQRRSR